MNKELTPNQRLIKSALFFDAWLSPKLILLIYRVLLAACVLVGLLAIVNGLSLNDGLAILFGLGLLILGPLVTRVICEGMIVIFKINENLQHIRLHQEQDQS